MHLIELKKVSKYYKSEDNVSVGMKNVSTTFDYNEFVAITGTSGSGKTTLLNVISGLDGYEDGEVYLNGEETSHYTISDWERYRASHVGFVFQNYNIIDSFTVYQNVMLALEIQNYPRKSRKKRALELIEKVGLLSHKNHKAAKLSGGQKQRAVIARALAKDCPIIVADEPTGNLDVESGKQILSLLHEISKDKLVVIVTHNYAEVAEYTTRRIKMHDGIIIEDKTIKEVNKNVEKPIEPAKKMNFLSILHFAFKNLISQPKRFIFILMLQFLVVGALTFVYTSQIKNIREAGLIYSDIFNFVPETRVIVQRRDGQELDDNDITYLNNLRDVKSVHKYGENFLSYEPTLYLRLNDYRRSNRVDFIDTASTINTRFMKGNLPKDSDEIVISQNFGYKLGDIIKLTNQLESHINSDNDPRSFYLREDEFVVTGIAANNNSTIYLSDAYLNANNDNDFVFDSNIAYDIYNQVYNYWGNLVYIVNGKPMGLIDRSSQLDDTYIKAQLANPEMKQLYGAFLKEPNETDELLNIEIIVGIQLYRSNIFQERTYTFNRKITLNENFDDKISNPTLMFNSDILTEIKDEIYEDIIELARIEVIENTSVSVSGRASGNRLIKRIDNDTYRVFYPANIKDPLRPVYVFLYSILAIITLSLVGSFLYFILHAVTKNVMSARQKDFAIYRSIGANRTDLGKLVIIEQIILSIVALIIVMLLFNILAYNNLTIAAIVDYLTLIDYITLFIIFTIFGALLGIRFNRKVFRQTVVETLSLAREDVL